MDIEVKTGFFNYTPGELTLSADGLCLCFGDHKLTIPAGRLRAAAFSAGTGGACRLELTTDTEQMEIFIPKREDADSLATEIYALAREAGRVELRMNGRSL